MQKRLRLESRFDVTVSALFAALIRTLAFRRWRDDGDDSLAAIPGSGRRYFYRTGSVARSGHVVEINRPVALTLKEVLHDPPCRVGLTMRWRVEPAAQGSSVRLIACYGLNQAARLSARHWERRLKQHFQLQFTHLARNLQQIERGKRDLRHF